MSSSNPASKCPKLVISNWLLDIGVSPLSHPPGYSGDCSASYPGSNPDGCSADHLEGNLASYLDSYSVSSPAGYPAGNSENCSIGCGDRCSAGCSADCPEIRSEGNPDSSLPSNEASSLLRYSESNPADSLPGCSESYRRRFDPRPVTEPAQVQGPDRPADWQLPKYHHRVPERSRDHRRGFAPA